jgi:hypothetical protein
MSHSFRLEKIDNPFLYNVYVAHNSDWSGTARIKWYRRVSEVESKDEEVSLPGVIVKALIENINGSAIESIEAVLQQLRNGQ